MKLRGAIPPRMGQLALVALVCAALGACKVTNTGSGTPFASSSLQSSPTIKSVTLSWSPPTKNSDGTSLTNLAGYTLHYGTTSQDYTGNIEITDPTATSYVVSNFPAGTYYFAISAYNSQQVSGPLSGEISVTID